MLENARKKFIAGLYEAAGLIGFVLGVVFFVAAIVM